MSRRGHRDHLYNLKAVGRFVLGFVAFTALGLVARHGLVPAGIVLLVTFLWAQEHGRRRGYQEGVNDVASGRVTIIHTPKKRAAAKKKPTVKINNLP